MNRISTLQRVSTPLRVGGSLGLALIVMILSVLMACVQDPSPKSTDDTLPQHALILEAQDHHRRGRHAEAMATYEQALALDSSLSEAYYGHAKATVAFFKIDKSAILEDFEKTAEDPSHLAFLDHSDSVLTLRLQAFSRVRSMLGKLTDRDTLTRWYNYLEVTTPWSDGVADTMYQQRRDFMTNYLIKADLDMPGYRKRAKFPLSDLKIPAASVVDDYLMSDLVYTITRLYDFDQNDTIDNRDAKMKLLNFGNNGGFTIDSLSNIEFDLETDSAHTKSLNELIANMSSGLAGSSQLATLIGLVDSSDLDPVADPQTSMDSVIASLGDAVLFYQFGDKLDNDGDGCIDEELMDEKDNDLDGFVDEDARVIPWEKPDGVDNDRDGFKDPINPAFPLAPGTDTLGREAPVGSELYPARAHVLGFVHAYLMATGQLNLPEVQTDWVRIKKNAPPEEMAQRLAIQKDSLAVRIPLGGPVPDSLKAKLQNAKNVIGGCWRNYP